MHLQFEKWVACGNDFILVYMNQYQELLVKKAKELCVRGPKGIGADGVLILSGYDKGMPDTLTIVNADGSIAKNCGNGLRCAAQSLALKYPGLVKEASCVVLRVLDREFTCYFNSFSHNQKTVEVDMGVVSLDEENVWHRAVCDQVKSFAFAEVHTADMGNKHVVICATELDSKKLEACAVSLQSLNLSLNVHMCREVDEQAEGPICQTLEALCFEKHTPSPHRPRDGRGSVGKGRNPEGHAL